MENTSPFLAMQRVEGQLKALIRQTDQDSLEQKERQALAKVRRLSTEARLDIRDYELSETREEQLKNASTGQRRLKQLSEMLDIVSFVFSPADSAQLHAELEHINSRLV